MTTFSTPSTICMYMQKHLITTRVCVEWWTEVSVFELLAFGELCECKLTH